MPAPAPAPAALAALCLNSLLQQQLPLLSPSSPSIAAYFEFCRLRFAHQSTTGSIPFRLLALSSALASTLRLVSKTSEPSHAPGLSMH